MSRNSNPGPEDRSVPPERPRRIQVSMDGVLIASDGIESKVRITDLSSDGFRIEHSEELVEGEQVLLRLGRETVKAEIRWVRGREAGGVFLQGTGL